MCTLGRVRYTSVMTNHTEITNTLIREILFALNSFTEIVWTSSGYKASSSSVYTGLADWELALLTNEKRLQVLQECIRNQGKIQVIKAARTALGNSLMEAKNLTEDIAELREAPEEHRAATATERYGLIDSVTRDGEGWAVTVSVGADRFTVYTDDTPNLDAEVKVTVSF